MLADYPLALGTALTLKGKVPFADLGIHADDALTALDSRLPCAGHQGGPGSQKCQQYLHRLEVRWAQALAGR